MKPRLIVPTAVLALVVAVAPACGSDDDTDTGSSADTTTTTVSAVPTITKAWARTSPMDVTKGAAYMVVRGGTSDDEITGVSVDTTIAAAAEIHETVEVASGAMDSTTLGGDAMASTTVGDAMTSTTLAPSMEMRPVDSIAVPAGTTVELKPGGYHVMLIGLVKPLVKGQSFDLTVTFAKAGPTKLTVEVKDAP